MHKEEGLSFKDVVTFNLDEYYPMKHGTWSFNPPFSPSNSPLPLPLSPHIVRDRR